MTDNELTYGGQSVACALGDEAGTSIVSRLEEDDPEFGIKVSIEWS